MVTFSSVFLFCLVSGEMRWPRTVALISLTSLSGPSGARLRPGPGDEPGCRPHAGPPPPHRSRPSACRLIDGATLTMEDEHMWLVPFSPGLDHIVTICFDRAESIAGLRFWNYNKSPEDTYRGVSRDGGPCPAHCQGKGAVMNGQPGCQRGA